MSRFFRIIKSSFRDHPFVSNAVVYGTLFVAAECSQQIFTRKLMTQEPKSLDSSSLFRYALFGTTIQGPILYTWYKWLDRNFAGTAVKIVVKKVALDQFLMTPPLYVIFYVAMSLMEGKKDIFEECTQKLLPTFKTSCLFWLPAQTVNFFLVPPSFRVIYVGACAFGWVNILCWFKRQEY